MDEYVGQHCTVEYNCFDGDGQWCGFGMVNGTVCSVADEQLTVTYGRRTRLTKVIPCSAVTDIRVDPPYDPERHGLRMEDVVGDTPQERLQGRIAVVRSWAEAARRDGDEDVATWLDDIADRMGELSWLVQL